MPIRFSLAAVLLVTFAAGFCASCGSEAKQTESRPPPLIVGPEDVIRAEEKEILTGPLISGNLQAEKTAAVRAEIGGSVATVTVDVGDAVEKGRLLARISANVERQAVTSAKAAVQTAETQLELAKRDAARTRRLVEGGALAERDLEQRNAAVTNAESALAQARAQLAQAQERLTDASVHAPIGGIVSASEVNAGDVIATGAEMFTIMDPSTMELRAEIPAESLAVLQVHTPIQFRIQGYADRAFQGEIKRIRPSTNPATGQLQVFASVPNVDGTLIAGLYAEGRLASGREMAVVIPVTAIKGGETDPYVLKIEGGQVRRQDVELGVRDERTGEVGVLSGVESGDLLLAGNLRDIEPGAEIEVRKASEGAAR